MSKEIKDYLHLYLGCDCISDDINAKLQSVGCEEMGEDCILSFQNNDEESGFYGDWTEANIAHKDIKPILRPLSDMIEEEETVLAKLCFDREDDFIITYRGMGYSIGNISEPDIHSSVRCIKIETFCEHPMINNWIPAALLQIDYTDFNQPIIIGRFEEQGKILRDDMIKDPFELTRYLLSKSFDLFGLIEAGLAIDKTTLN